MVVIRPVSATVMRSDGTAAAAPPGQSKANRPTSALLRGASGHPHHHAHGSGAPIKTSSNGNNNPLRGRIRPETAKPSRSSLVHAANEESKRLIHEIFDVCDTLHVDVEFVEALHRNLQSCSLTDTQVFANLLASLHEHRRATVQVLKKIEARERVMRCFEQFADATFLASQHATSGGSSGTSLGSSSPGDGTSMSPGRPAMGSSNPAGVPTVSALTNSGSGKELRCNSSHQASAASHRDSSASPVDVAASSPVSAALRRLLEHHSEALEERLLTLGDRLPVLSAEGDAILQSLHQCTEAVERALEDWDVTAEQMWSGVCAPPGQGAVQAAGGAPTSSMATSVGGNGTDGWQRPTPPPTAAATPTTTFDVAMPQVQHLVGISAPASMHRRVFPWRGADYKAKMRLDIAPFEALQERWSLGHLAKVADAQERRNKRERLLANDCALRAHTEAVAVRTRDEFLNVAAAKIQAMFRGHRAAMWFQMYLLKLKAIRCISKWWRKIKLRQRFVSATDYGRAAVNLQRLWRAYVTRRAFPKLLKANRAAKVIQRWWRYWDCHWRMVLRHMERQNRLYAAAVVSRALQQFVCRWKLRRRRRVHWIVVDLQRWCRGRACAQALFAQGRTGAYDEDLTVLVPSHVSLVQVQSPPRGGCCDDDTDVNDCGVRAALSLSCIATGDMTHMPDADPDATHCALDDGNTTTASPPKAVVRSGLDPAVSRNEALSERGPDVASPTPDPIPPAAGAIHALGVPEVVPADVSEVPICEGATVGFQCSSSGRDAVVNATSSHPIVASRTATDGGASASTTVSPPHCPNAGRSMVPAACAPFEPPAALTQPAAIERTPRALRQDRGDCNAIAMMATIDLVAACLLARHASNMVRHKRRVQLFAERRAAAVSPVFVATRSIQRWWCRVVRRRLRERRSLEDVLLATFAPVPLKAHAPTQQEQQHAMPSSGVPLGTHRNVMDAVLAPSLAPAGPSRAPLTDLASKPRVAPPPAQQVHAAIGGQGPQRLVVVPFQGAPLGQPSLVADALRRRKQAAMLIGAWAARIVRSRSALAAAHNAASSTIARAYRHHKLQRSYYMRKAQQREAARVAAEVQARCDIEAHQRRQRTAALAILHWYQQIECSCLLRRLDAGVMAIKHRPDRDASAQRIQRFWALSKERLQTLRLNRALHKELARVHAEERIVRAAVKIQGRYRTFLHRHVIEQRRSALHANRSAAAVVIQKHVRKWLAKNVFWQEKMSKLSMFRELQRLRQKERARISGAPLLPQAPRHAW